MLPRPSDRDSSNDIIITGAGPGARSHTVTVTVTVATQPGRLEEFMIQVPRPVGGPGSLAGRSLSHSLSLVPRPRRWTPSRTLRRIVTVTVTVTVTEANVTEPRKRLSRLKVMMAASDSVAATRLPASELASRVDSLPVQWHDSDHDH
jgi:hypothetical protein